MRADRVCAASRDVCGSPAASPCAAMLTETHGAVDADVDGMLRNVDADVYECSRMLTFVDIVQGAPPVAPEIARCRAHAGRSGNLGTLNIVVPAKAGTQLAGHRSRRDGAALAHAASARCATPEGFLRRRGSPLSRGRQKSSADGRRDA